MKNFTHIEPSALAENPIKLIGQDWMLIGSGDSSKFNAMTASWGSMGFYANKPIVTIFVRPERYTFEFLERNERFTLTVLEEEYKSAHQTFGKLSGRNCDKVELTKLTPLFTPQGNPTFEQAKVVVECRKIFSQRMTQEGFTDQECYNKWYGEGHGGDHVLFIAEIENCWVK